MCLFPSHDSQYAQIELSCQLQIYHKLVDNGRVHAGVRRTGIELMVATRRVFYQPTRAVASCVVSQIFSRTYTRDNSAQRARDRAVDRSRILDRSILKTVSRLNERG